jgi:hypothetical protein
MKKFVYIYNGPQSNEPPSKKVFEAWNAWFGKLGDKLVDGGNPLSPAAKRVTEENGVSDLTSGQALGYSIVNAESIDEATEMAKGCPVLGAHCSVDVYEALPM